MFELIPVVEGQFHDHPFQWAASEASAAFVELSSQTPEPDVAWVVALLAAYNDVEGEIAGSESIEAVVHHILQAESLILPGGLLVRRGKRQVPPSCCCGLEGWREWFGVEPGADSPWLGHDPSPWVECKPNSAKVWTDANLGKKSTKISVSYADLEIARQSARNSLLAFADNLSNWLSGHSSKHKALTQRFSEAFEIY